MTDQVVVQKQDTPDPESFDFPVYWSQGGALVREKKEGDRFIYYFVEQPHPSLELNIGDKMPEDWGVIPANKLAKDLCEREDPANQMMSMREIIEVIDRHRDVE